MKKIYISDLHNHIGEEVALAGWVHNRRDHGKLVFIDLRDYTGVVQMVVSPKAEDAHQKAEEVRSEWVIEIKGTVNERPEKMVNPEIETGDIEISVSDLKVHSKAKTPPFEIDTDGYEIGEEHRLQYRYLDLRRQRMTKNLRNRHNFTTFARNFLSDKGFIEVETPILTKSTPEGARDYIVPSRVEKGNFYALPQSPQQYKQLLMASGLEKYFQIARCMRDEDTRGDRQPEFTQLDIELSFADQEDILSLTEEFYTKMVEELYPQMNITQKPWPRLDYYEVMEKYGTDRPDIRENPEDPNELGFAWVVDFPLFEEEKENGYYAPSHHMFTSPKEEDLDKLESDPHSVRSYQHDLVLNGNEIAGGSVRINTPEVQKRVFDLIGFTEEQSKRFAHMLEAFEYGVPPHGGIAASVDRSMMVFENESNIREMIAFPKTGEGKDLMIGAPSRIDEVQLKEVGIELSKEAKQELEEKEDEE